MSLENVARTALGTARRQSTAIGRSLHEHGRRAVVEGVRRAAPVADRKNWLKDAGGAELTPRLRESLQDTDRPAPLPPVLTDFNHMLHELRTIELGRMPATSGVMLSAGCADGHFFRWIEQAYQEVPAHIGLELYLPRPDELPENVTWIANSVGSMTDVADGSVSLVYSGQNFEHLFGDDAVDFLLESRRVLEPDGWLVIDSPHRDIATALDWIMPEHTVEFTPSEARELVELAGFDVASMRGLWLCRDPRTEEHLPLWTKEDGSVPSPAEVLRRSVLGSADVERSFVWWMEARRADREPDVRALRRRHAEIFQVAWHERQQRLRYSVGTLTTEEGHSVVTVPAGVQGHAMFGPYAPLLAGTHDVTFTVRRRGPVSHEGALAVLEVTDLDGDALVFREVGASELPADEWVAITVRATPADVVWGAQFRVLCTGRVALDVRLAVGVDDSSTRTAPASLR